MNNMSKPIENIIALYRERRYELAHQYVMRNLADAPNDGKQWELCGLIRNALKDRDGAIDALEHAVVLVPLSAAGQCTLAHCYTTAGHKQLAREMFEFLMSKTSLPTRLLPLIAVGCGRIGELELALEACRRAADANVDGADPIYGMAHYMERLDYPPEVIMSLLHKAIELEPGRIRFRIALAKTLCRIGSNDEAYSIIGIIRKDEIQTIHCRHRLRQLASIYTAVENHEMADYCIRQLKTISFNDNPTE